VKVDKKPNNARELYARFHQLNVEVDELPDLVIEKKVKVIEILDRVPPWSHWYELSWKKVLGFFLILAGMDEVVIQASKTYNPQKYLFEYIDENPDPINDDDLSDDEKALLISLFMNVLHQMQSLAIFSESLSDLVAKAKNDDEALLDAVIVDRSVVSCPVIAKRIQYAQLVHDESFLNKLAKAITRTRPRRPESEYDDLRYMLEAVDEMKEYQGFTIKEKYELLAVELELFDIDNKKDAFGTFQKLHQRRNIRKET
jgi:hypothetical protein